MKLKLAFIFTLALPAVPAAHAEPWLCTNAYGVREFSYDPQAPGMKNCIDHPIRPGNRVGRKSRDDGSQNDAGAVFPRVDARTQKERDTARRAILERELGEERRALALAMQQLAEQKELRAKAKNPGPVEEMLKLYHDRVRVHSANIANLEKELGRDS
jgi:hypothetical protein